MTQHVQVGETRHFLNEHGVTIEQTFWKPSSLSDTGRCCGRKPIRYVREFNGWFCSRCNRQYTPTGLQQQNWAYKLDPAGCYERQKPLQPGATT